MYQSFHPKREYRGRGRSYSAITGEREVCSWCKGSGYRGEVTCDRCRGSGEVWYSVLDLAASYNKKAREQNCIADRLFASPGFQSKVRECVRDVEEFNRKLDTFHAAARA